MGNFQFFCCFAKASCKHIPDLKLVLFYRFSWQAMGFIDSFPSFCLERFGLYLWQGRGEMDSEADAGVFQDRFRHFRTTRFVRKGYFFFFCYIWASNCPCRVVWRRKTNEGCKSILNLICLGKKAKGTKRYMPQKNSVAYALLIALYRYKLEYLNSYSCTTFFFFLFPFGKFSELWVANFFKHQGDCNWEWFYG